MRRPDPSPLIGIHRSPNNRHEWNFSHIPSPRRTSVVLVPADLETGGRHTQEAIPLICAWCGQPWWPHWSITQGCCSDACRQAQSDYLNDRRTKGQILQELQTDLVSAADLEELIAELRARLAEEAAENARLRGEMGKSLTT